MLVYDLNQSSQQPTFRHSRIGVFSIVCADGLLYMSGPSGGMLVWDMSDPEHPREVAKYVDSACYNSGGVAADVALQNGVIYVADTDGGLLSMYISSEAAHNGETVTPPTGGWVQQGQSLNWNVDVPNLMGHVTYQWLKNDIEIPGATGSTFHSGPLLERDTGWYSCRVTDAAKAVYQTKPVYVRVYQGTLPAASPLALIALVVALAGAAYVRKRRIRS